MTATPRPGSQRSAAARMAQAALLGVDAGPSGLNGSGAGLVDSRPVEPGVDGGMIGIAAVARELGVSVSTLRRWERRYGTVVAGRVNGRRVYDPDQVATLRRVVEEIRGGASTEAAHKTASTRRPWTLRVNFQPTLEAPSSARWAVDKLLDGRGGERFAFDLRLVASEAVKHAVVHGSSLKPIEMEIRLFLDRAELKVKNGGSPVSMKALRAKRRDQGQGLKIVDAVSDTWSIESDPTGTEITARVTRRDD